MIKLHLSPGVAAISIAALLATASLPAQSSGTTTLAPRKPHDSGVDVTYRMDATPQLGEVTPVVLKFSGVTHANGAEVRFGTDPGLSVQGNRTLELPAGKQTAATVFLVSESEGLSYLHVFVTQGDGMSAISIPVQTGTTATVMKPSPELKRNSRGEKIISMPAS